MRVRSWSVLVAVAISGVATGAANPLEGGGAPAGARHPLLAVEQQRATLVQRIVTEWTAELSAQPIDQRPTPQQWSQALFALRADRLLAASFAGSLAAVEAILQEDRAERAGAPRVAAKSIGDANADLSYTPLNPCRIADTRVAGGALAANVQRQFDGYNASSFAAQGGTATNCGMPNGVAAIAMNVYAVNPTNLGFIKVWAANAAEPAVSTVNYQTGITAIATGAIVPVQSASSNRFLAKSPAGVDFVADVVGYFKAPGDATGLDILVNGQRVVRYAYAPVVNVIAGSPANSASASESGQTIAGGGSAGTNCLSATGSCANQTSQAFATIGGGYANSAGGSSSTVSGGNSNEASANSSSVAGGFNNRASAAYATVTGGANNAAGGAFATVAGGSNNAASGNAAFIAGGVSNVASASTTFAAGRDVLADIGGCAVFGFFSSGPANCKGIGNIVRVMASHGMTVDWGPATGNGGGAFWVEINDITPFRPINVYNGAYLSSGGTWTSASDRNLKEAFAAVEPRDVLARLVALPVTQWRYKAEPGVARMGPVAQDFHAAFGLGLDELTIASTDAAGVAFAAIQGLHQVVAERDREIADLRDRVRDLETLRDEMAALKVAVGELAATRRVLAATR